MKDLALEDCVVFLDRDGTINCNYKDGPVYQIERMKLLPGAAESIRMLNDVGVKVMLVTNQGGIRHKDRDFDWERYYKMDRLFRELLYKEAQAYIDDVFLCYHADYEGCVCRKPRTGLFEQAYKSYAFDVDRSFMVGDLLVDICAGNSFGLQTILVESGAFTIDKKKFVGMDKPDQVFPGIRGAVEYIIDQLNSERSKR